MLDLQLRAMGKQTTTKEVTIRKVPLGGSHETDRTIERWIKDISDLHRSKPPPSVLYTKPMPDIDSLMQEWPSAVESLLRCGSSDGGSGLPNADFECDTLTFVDLICAVCDIPVYKSRIQSLHVLFTLYSAFRNSHHFGSSLLPDTTTSTTASEDAAIGTTATSSTIGERGVLGGRRRAVNTK